MASPGQRFGFWSRFQRGLAVCTAALLLTGPVAAVRAGSKESVQIQLDVTVMQTKGKLAHSVIALFLKPRDGKTPAQLADKSPGVLSFGVLNSSDTQDFRAVLQAMRAENLCKVIAEPRLITLSGQSATFFSGGELPVSVPAGLGQVVQHEEFGMRLKFLPMVLDSGRIYVEVEPEISTLSAPNGTTIQGKIIPGRTTNRLHTTVQLDLGQTFAIAGIEDGEMETVILVTPSLVRAPNVTATVQTTAASVVAPMRENEEQLRNMEQKLKRAQQQIDELQRELRSLGAVDGK